MRDAWFETTFGEVVFINPEAARGIADDDEIVYVDLSSVSAESGISSDLYRGSFAEAPGRARRVIRTQDVLVSTVRPYLRGFALVPEFLDGEIASTGFAVLRAKPHRILPGLVWAIVGMNNFVDYLMDRATGSSYPAVRPEDISSFSFFLPPLDEQKRIVDVLSSVDVYINALKQQVGTARAARKAVLNELLSTSGDGWSECSLGDIAEVLDRMRKPISGSEREKRLGNVPYYGATGQAGWIDKPIFDEELVLLGEDAIDFLNPDVHKAYLVSGPSWVNNHAHVLRAKREKVLSFFLMESLNAVDYSQFVAFGTRSKLTQGSMMGISVQVPPLEEQKQIVEIVSSIDDVIQSTEQAVTVAKNLRSGLLSDLLSGEHEIPASYDLLLGAA